MTEAALQSIVEDTLNIPVFLGQESIIYPAATLEIQIQNPALFGDGKSVRRAYDVFINLWYEDKESRDSALAELMSALDQINGITAPDIESSRDGSIWL